ncbi:unnamed protein product [Symbiodinium pilosum]|uniref:Very-long-chain 3-oxoacyl-CoA synthase n=1 Tax=Symbiodinium pilosum TaxID=2952 RepID=A0A812JFM9_SYMPI|nr:unnamed protein product [Symbiodinium pilosum]
MYQDFTWGNAPLSSLESVLGLCSLYLCTLVCVDYVVPRSGFDLTKVVIIHNLVLSMASAILFVGCAAEVVSRATAEGTLQWLFCEHVTHAEGPLYFWSYLFFVLDASFSVAALIRLEMIGDYVLFRVRGLPVSWVFFPEVRSCRLRNARRFAAQRRALILRK